MSVGFAYTHPLQAFGSGSGKLAFPNLKAFVLYLCNRSAD